MTKLCSEKDAFDVWKWMYVSGMGVLICLSFLSEVKHLDIALKAAAGSSGDDTRELEIFSLLYYCFYYFCLGSTHARPEHDCKKKVKVVKG